MKQLKSNLKKKGLMVKKPDNCVIYVRVTTKEQAKEGFSLDTQEEECTKFAKSSNLNVLKIFKEKGQSARTTNRPEFIEMMKYCKERESEIKSIIVSKPNRLAYSIIDLISIEEQLKDLGIRVLYVTESSASNAINKLRHSIFYALVQHEHKLMSEMTIKGMRFAFVCGYWQWKPPFGYIRNKENKKLIPDKKTSPIVREIFEKFATGKYTQASIVRELKSNGIELKPSHLSHMLRNPIYCGYMYKPEWYPEPIKGKFEAIIPPQLFNTVQDIIFKFKNNNCKK